jgi:glyoxalase family protein
MPVISGLHHVTAFAKDPAANLRFYTSVLGLKLVKRTVNFDDPFTYHLYYGDRIGTPGTLLTFFPQPRSARGRYGVPEIGEIDLAVEPGSLGQWEGRLSLAGVPTQRVRDETGERLHFHDPDGIRLALIERSSASGHSGALPVDRVTLHVPNAKATVTFLTKTLGFTHSDESDGRHELVLGPADAAASGGIGGRITVLQATTAAASTMGAGSVHHVAWRVPNEAAQKAAAQAILSAGIAVTPIIDRQYFHSIYFRIPGGMVFEIATDGPGFDIDEPAELLGTTLKLPPQHEPRREEIQRHLLPLGSA